MARVDKVANGVYSNTAKIGTKSSTDGAPHVIEFSAPVQNKPKGWSDEDYDAYLYGIDLTAGRAAKGASNLLASAPALSPEDKAANKVARGLKRDEEGFKAQIARMSPEDIKAAMDLAGV